MIYQNIFAYKQWFQSSKTIYIWKLSNLIIKYQNKITRAFCELKSKDEIKELR
jgi:hypothetical protein